MKDITYSIDRFNKYGDIFEECIILNLKNGTMLNFKDVEELDNLIKEMNECSKQIKLEIYED